jgi:excinuclease ABC subunit A
VLDEPSIGLHVRDGLRLIEILKKLRDMGNTVLVVEHDRETMRAADHLIDLGPAAGEHGGEVVYAGNYHGLVKHLSSLTARYLRDEMKIPVPVFRRSSGRFLEIMEASEHNLKNIDVKIPLGVMVCVTGVSGSGKSTLVYDVLYTALKRSRGEWRGRVGTHREIRGAHLVSDVVLVDQSPIGKTPRSNPVTYVKAFDDIRALFASTREARAHGYTAGYFSFNVPGGRCDECQGSGTVVVEMQFLADVELTCEECKGTRFKAALLEVTYRGKNIHQVLNLTVKEALSFFAHSSRVVEKLKIMDEVGLGYLRLGQSATTLSGGEAQRVKLASYLSQRVAPNTLYVFDEPTTGLHFDDINKLLAAFNKLLAAGASLLIVEHNLDVIKSADWVIDLGPEAGERGGSVVACGTPEELAAQKGSYTGQFLASYLLEPQKA